jgi:hypothetical protein
MINTSVSFNNIEQSLFDIDIPLELFKKKEEEIQKIIEQYYWLPLDPIISTEIKEKVEKLLWKQIITYQRKQKLKKLNELKR